MAARENTYSAWLELGDALMLWGEEGSSTTKAIAAYERARLIAPARAEVHFRLGVAHRKRYDAPQLPSPVVPVHPNPIATLGFPSTEHVGARPNDFQAAVEHWGRALELEPNQYIYRRRIQQYGPRLIKPYPFYDWVQKARLEIAARGDTPIKLRVEPSGAELASPAKQFVSAVHEKQSPDADGKINRDTQNLVVADAVVVPVRVKRGESVRVHVTFRPHAHAHWNNETSPLVFWLELPSGWKADRQWFESSMPRQAESAETRSFDFELKAPDSATELTVVKAYALYYVCETTRGACLFLRQDVEIPVNINVNGSDHSAMVK